MRTYSESLAIFWHTYRSHILIIFVLCSIAAVYRIGALDLTPSSDYSTYVATAELFSGKNVTDVFPERILKPLAPALVAAGAPFVGFFTAFLVEVLLMYAALVAAFYYLALHFFSDRHAALLTTLLGSLSYPILRYGLDLYTETGALFFYVLALGLTLSYMKVPRRSTLIGAGVIIGLGLLWKEYTVVNGLILGIVLLCESRSMPERIERLVILAITSLGPTLAIQYWVYIAYGYTYLNWYQSGGISGFATEFTVLNLTKSTAALLGLGWLLVPIAVKYRSALDTIQTRFISIVVPSTLVVFAWGYVSSRLFFVMAPAFMLLATFGLLRFPRPLQYALLTLILAANIAWLTVSIHYY